MCQLTHTIDPNWKRSTLHLWQKVTQFSYLRRKKKRSLTQQQLSQWETAITLPMKSYYTLNFQFSPMDSLFTTVSPKSIKEDSSPLFLWTCPRITIRLHVLNCNSLLYPNKPILLEKRLAFCLRSTPASFFLVNILPQDNFIKLYSKKQHIYTDALQISSLGCSSRPQAHTFKWFWTPSLDII